MQHRRAPSKRIVVGYHEKSWFDGVLSTAVAVQPSRRVRRPATAMKPRLLILLFADTSKPAVMGSFSVTRLRRSIAVIDGPPCGGAITVAQHDGVAVEFRRWPGDSTSMAAVVAAAGSEPLSVSAFSAGRAAERSEVETVTSTAMSSTTPPGGSSASPPAAGDDDRPPPRLKGMLGPDTREEFPAFNGWQVSAGRSQVETFTESDAGMVLDGDGTGGHGYHRNGLGIKRDEFPPGFGTDAVVDLTNSIFDHPTDAMPGRRSDAFSVYGTYRGVPSVIRVRYEENVGWRIATVHPYDALRWNDERDRLGH